MELLKTRHLGAMEKLFWLLDQISPSHFVIAAELCGPLEADELSRVLTDIRLRHPLLFSRIVDNGCENPYFEYIPHARIPLRVINRCIEGLLEREMEKELSAPFDYNVAPLIRCVLIRDEAHPILLFAVHHAVSDGISMTMVIRDIIGSLSGKRIEALPFPPSADQLIDSESREGLAIGYQKRIDKIPASRSMEAGPRVFLQQLSADLSCMLLAKCKLERTSFQGMLYAAAVIAARKAALPWSQSRIKVIVPVSVRKTITHGESSALYLSSKAICYDGKEEKNFWQVSRNVKEELSTAKDLCRIRENAVSFRKMLFNKADQGRLGNGLQGTVDRDLVVSNLGRVSYGTSLKNNRLKHIWGPLTLSGSPDEIMVSAATVNDTICISVVSSNQNNLFHSLLLAALEQSINL